jgi:glycerophosphoryl diester phosphodiesterase
MMQKLKVVAVLVSTFVSVTAAAVSAANNQDSVSMAPQLGVRPFYLVENMDAGTLKSELSECKTFSFEKTDFSIGHRGASMQFPEHTRESYIAAAQMGAGIVECDVTFTRDRELVCRHSQCDLDTTTNILAIPELAAKCSEPFKPAEFDFQTGEMISEASAKCCTSDITLEEFKRLKGKMDGADKMARTVEEYLAGTPSWRSDLYSAQGTLVTHAESIALFKDLGVKMTPELKSPSVTMPYEGNYSQQDYAQQMIDEYKKAGVSPDNVFVQSFNLDDILFWLEKEPMFGKQAVYLDGRYDDKSFNHTKPETWSPTMEELFKKNVRIIAPPMWMLLALDSNGKMVASEYAKQAKEAGLGIITWTLERSGLLDSGGGWYYQSVKDSINNDGDMFQALDILAVDVGVMGVFSDWPATVTYYANCRGLK